SLLEQRPPPNLQWKASLSSIDVTCSFRTRLMSSIDEIYLAQHLFEQRRFQECMDRCGKLLQANSLDQAAWFLKLRAITERDLIDDSDLEPEGIAEMLLDENALAGDSARPGTSLQRPLTAAQGLRPMTGMQRLNTGFARPTTTYRYWLFPFCKSAKYFNRARLGTATDSVKQTLQSGRPGTSRPITVAGRQIRLGTQSMLLAADNDNFINSMQIDIEKFTKRPVSS
ncbi:hypothetical protein BVRB_024760, partial [Beta vulgaris subsp. vulgaris]